MIEIEASIEVLEARIAPSLSLPVDGTEPENLDDCFQLK